MSLESYIRAMPKVELHVHLEGSIGPGTLLALARRNGEDLPATTAAELSEWYRFRDFPHFVDIYFTICRCLDRPEDLELITREFLAGQARQNVLHSEVTFTAHTHYRNGMAFDDQLEAINRARDWGRRELGVSMTLTIDYARNFDLEGCLMSADWAVAAKDDGVSAFGLGGPEVGHPPEKFEKAFDRARAGGLPSAPHAGETEGPASIWGALRALGAQRIGHGVRCLEDPELVEELRERRIPLEVCPSSNVCLGVVGSLAEHPLPRLLEAGLVVTVNSDDPPMFNTTLTDELLRVSRTFGLDAAALESLNRTALECSFLDDEAKSALRDKMEASYRALRLEHLG